MRIRGWAWVWAVWMVATALPGAPRAAVAQTTQPSGAPSPALELRANQAFNRGEYAVALPLLRKMAASLNGQPDQLGPVHERIRVCEKNLTAAVAGAAPTTAAVTVSLADGSSAAPQRRPHPPWQPGQVLEMSIKELGNFEYDAQHGGGIPPDVQRLSGAQVRLAGFVVALDQSDNLTHFGLVPSLSACCFGQPPQLQHTVLVNCPEGQAVGYCADPIEVQGTLKVQEQKDDGFIVGIFEVDAASVRVSSPGRP